MKFIIGSRGSGVTTNEKYVEAMDKLAQIAWAVGIHAEDIIASAKQTAETTTMTFQEALDKEIEKLRK